MSDPNGPQGPYGYQPGQPGQRPGPSVPPPGYPGATAYAPPPAPPKKRRVWLWVLIGVLALVLIVIVGCTAIVGSAINEAAKSSQPSTIPSGAASASGGSSSAPASGSNGTAKFGDTVKYDDGIAVSIIKTRNGKTSKYSEHPGSPTTSFFVKVTNGTSENLNGSYVSVDVSYGKDGSPADQVFDSTNFSDQISGTIGQGKSKTGEYAFAVPTKERGDVTVEVSFVDFDHDNAIFSGSVK